MAEQKLRVYHIINGVVYNQEPVKDVEMAMKLIDKWTEQDLHNPRIEFNAFGLEEYDEEYTGEDGEHWCEWYNENGEDILEIMDNREESNC